MKRAFQRKEQPRTRVRETPDPRRKVAALLFALCMVVYLGNLRTVPILRGGDTIPNRLIPFALLAHGTTALDSFRPDLVASGARTWYLKEQRGALVSFYSVGVSIAALPVYVPVYALLALGGPPSSAIMFALSEPTEKFAASSLTALGVVFFYLTVRRRMTPRGALGAALAFGFASSMWATASQMLWQQTSIVLALALALWFLTWPDLPRRACAGAGFALSLAVATRPTAGLLFLAGLTTVLLTEGDARFRRQRALAFLVASLPLIAIGLGINLYYFGHPAGGYGGLVAQFKTGLFTTDRLLGIAGLLVSPNRGLLVFTPIASLGIWGLARSLRPGRSIDPVLAPLAVACLLHLFMVGSFPVWWGGWSFGPRYLVDILPVLALAAAGVWNDLGTTSRRVAVIAIVWSLLVQINGAFCFPASRWDGRMTDPATAAWSLKDFELAQDFRAWVAARRWSTAY